MGKAQQAGKGHQTEIPERHAGLPWHMEGEKDMPSGLKGTVSFADDIGQIHVKWEMDVPCTQYGSGQFPGGKQAKEREGWISR